LKKKTCFEKKKKFETTFEIFLKYRNHRISSSNESEALASHPEKPMEINGPQREKNPGESACHEISVTFCHYVKHIRHSSYTNKQTIRQYAPGGGRDGSAGWAVLPRRN
jgi:hypothetical protein